MNEKDLNIWWERPYIMIDSCSCSVRVCGHLLLHRVKQMTIAVHYSSRAPNRSRFKKQNLLREALFTSGALKSNFQNLFFSSYAP